jgi:hypothetical protein
MRRPCTGREMKKIFLLPAALMFALAPLAAQTVVVTSPNGGESWPLRSLHAITWNSTNAGGAVVNITLRKGNPSTKVGDIKVGIALKAGSWTWDSAGRLADGTEVPAGTDYIVRINIVGMQTHDDSNAAFAITGTKPLVMKKLSPLERPPVRLVLPPHPIITEYTMDKETSVFHFSAQNTGGPMTQNAKVVLLLPGGKELSLDWLKEKPTFAFTHRLFAYGDIPHLAPCTVLGGGDFCLRIEIRSPEIQGFPYPGLYDQRCCSAYQDLTVAGFDWEASGKLSFSVGNIGVCPSCLWSYRLYRMGQLVETSSLYSGLGSGQWTHTTAAYTMPANSGGSCLFKVEVIPQSPVFEKNKGNDACEFRVTPRAVDYGIIISDIRVDGEVYVWGGYPPTSDEYNRLVFFLKNTTMLTVPSLTARCQIAIDNVQVDEHTFVVSFNPGEEREISHSTTGIRFPSLPSGTHTVTVWVNICPTFLRKTMSRPQG